jgi:hypothetical protein
MPAALSQEKQSKLDIVLKARASMEKRHEHHRRQWERWYRLYRSYREFKRQYARAGSANDVDEILHEARTGFGADLFIPMCFSVIETTLPRMLSSNPKLLVTPGDPKSEDNCDGMKLIVEMQQERTKFSLAAQDVCKSGLIYGLGVGKTLWARETRNLPSLMQNPLYEIAMAQGIQGEKPWVEGPIEEKVLYEGPRFEAVDIFDFMWNADAYNHDTLEEVIHRSWRSTKYVRKMVDSGAWKLPRGWKIDDVLAGDRSKYDEVWGERQLASGMSKSEADEPGREVHEVLEWHDGEEVVIVLNCVAPVAYGPNPSWHGEIPFQINRPTAVPHEMVGIGEVEAIEDLQEELNTLRSQRRDNALLVLQRPFAYFEGFLDPADIEFGAAKMWPVDGPPSELLFPIPLQDIPFSSYREEEELKGDIDRVSGISDVTAGADAGAAETATGVQLVQAAAGIRIQNKTKRFEEETVQEVCEQWVSLNQQHIVMDVDVPGPPQPWEGDREFSWYKVGPAELAGRFFICPEGGSMSPQNEAMKEQRAQGMVMAFGANPYVNQRELAKYGLEHGFAIKNVERLLVPEVPDVPAAALDLVAGTLAEVYGVDPAEFEAMVGEAMQQVEQGAMDPTFGSVGDQVPQSRQAPQVGPPAGPPAG